MINHEEYLGDGLYVNFDGYMITLRAPRDHGDHWVGLEPEILQNFELYVKRLKAFCSAARQEAQ